MNTQCVSSIRIMAAALAMLSCTAMETTSTPLAAQPTVIVAASSAGDSPSMEEMLVQRDRASRLTFSGHYAAARVQWGRVARMQRALGELPLEALRTQAEISHVLGRDAEAASVLERLGEEALAGGNPDVSAEAFLDAAALYQSVQMRKQARRCMEQVERLLGSSALDPEQRASLESRIVRG